MDKLLVIAAAALIIAMGANVYQWGQDNEAGIAALAKAVAATQAARGTK